MTKLTKQERTKILRAVDSGWTGDGEYFRDVTRHWPEWLYFIATDCLMVLDQEPWRNFGDVLNEVLDY